MNFNELSKEDQELLNIDFGSELEKQASENAQEILELQEMGFCKMAEAAADEMDKEEEEKEEEKEEELDEEQSKEAAVKGAILADSYIEGLMKIGSERHGDELHYLYPSIAEALIKEGADAGAVAKFMSAVKGQASKAWGATKGVAKKVGDYAKDKANKAKDYATKDVKDYQKHKKNLSLATERAGKKIPGMEGLYEAEQAAAKEGLKGAKKAIAKKVGVGLGATAAGAGTIYGGKKLYDKYKK